MSKASFSSKSSMSSKFIPIAHSKLRQLVKPFLSPHENAEAKTKTPDDNNSHGEVLLDEFLFDFGCKYRIIIYRGVIPTGDNGNGNRNGDVEVGINSRIIMMHMSVFGWEEVKVLAVQRLEEVLGSDNVIVAATDSGGQHEYNQATDNCSDNQHSKSRAHLHQQHISTECVAPGFNVCIRVHSHALPKGYDEESMCIFLSEIRMVLLGSGLTKALESLSPEKNEGNQVTGKNGKGNNNGTDTANATNQNSCDKYSTIPIQRPSSTTLAAHLRSAIIVSSHDRVVVVTPFVFHDETDCAIAKLFLQQFKQAQSKATGMGNASVPICDYRKGNDPPLEAIFFQKEADSKAMSTAAVTKTAVTKTPASPKYITASVAVTSSSLDKIHNKKKEYLAGYLSLTFLEPKNVSKAVENVLLLLDTFDFHLKSSKASIDSKLRKKKHGLLKLLEHIDE